MLMIEIEDRCHLAVILCFNDTISPTDTISPLDPHWIAAQVTIGTVISTDNSPRDVATHLVVDTDHVDCPARPSRNARPAKYNEYETEYRPKK